jgi:DNA-binding NtrC family response regulator
MKTILIVDDEPTILFSLFHLFSGNNVTVITCDRIEEAEEALARYKFDLVIADIRLTGIQGIEGLELLTYIKRLHPETPVIIMTAYGTAEIRKDAYSRGAFYYFEKPIDINILTDKASELGIDLNLNP